MKLVNDSSGGNRNEVLNHDDDEDVVEVSKVHTVCCLESEKFGGCGHRTTFTNSAMAGGRQGTTLLTSGC